ncbi:MAG: ATP-binding protein [Dermatophilaceae bacterium]
MARRLRPEELEQLGVVSALAALASDFSAHTGAQVRRRIAPGLPTLTAETQLVIYRVAQEALTNAARHSEGDTVELSLSRDNDAVVLRVADNGRGLNGAAPGAGLRGMRERALLVDGQLTVRDAPAGGTEVRLIVPLARNMATQDGSP